MEKISRQLRLVAFALLSSVMAMAFAAVDATTTGAQEEAPCALEGPETGPCIENLEHVYDGQCEGVDCYTAIEWCCLEGISN